MPTVVIDPGHGGATAVGGSSPNNATGPNGLREKDLTLDLARRVSATLQSANVILTRTGDQNLSLSERARVAHDADADAFVSIHMNGFTDARVDGAEAWVATHAQPPSRALARSLLDRVLAVTHTSDRGVRVADMGVLLPERVGNRTAASLLEVAFLSNPQQAQRLESDDYRQAIAQAIADAIASQLHGRLAQSQAHAACAPSALKLALTPRAVAYAHPLYDTGEHVESGGDLYADQLRVGQSPGVLFSFGELIAMGDLYASAEDMMNADTDELTRLKTLIDRSTAYYQGGKSESSLDVWNETWDTETGGRYLKLAADNYEHFSPNTLFTDAAAMAATEHGTNKSTWETYHRQAIEEAQRLALAPENQGVSYLPMQALIINAFGDHFLTDAFASGHLINKEVMIAYFRNNFFSGSSLNSDADAFFDRVADAAWVSPVSDKFSELETTNYPVCMGGWCLRWRPNIDTKRMFKRLLVTAAEEEPVRVGNFVVKALHDLLNRTGIEVINAAGDGPWRLYGDGHLDTTTLGIMRRAVQQSVANVNDPAILATNLDFGEFFDRVWRYTPRLTTTSAPQLRALVQQYTDPTSDVLSTAAAEIIRSEVESMIGTLIKEGKLRHDPSMSGSHGLSDRLAGPGGREIPMSARGD